MDIREFINANKNANVTQLALQNKVFNSKEMAFALNQIECYQSAKYKISMLANTQNFLFPSKLSVEQCSSEFTATYKQQLVNRLVSEKESFIDLTGGFGVDFIYISKLFKTAVYIEQQTELCDVAKHNFNVLNLNNVSVYNADCVNFLNEMNYKNLIFIDPARRGEQGKRLFNIADCMPNVIDIQETMLKKAEFIVTKLSPMFDYHKAISELHNVIEVHIISQNNECKELLMVQKREYNGSIDVHCVNNKDVLTFKYNVENKENNKMIFAEEQDYITQKTYLYEPNASIMKAGCLCVFQKYNEIKQMASNSNLFISNSFIDNFHGRSFVITNVLPMKVKDITKALNGKTQANVSVRNFPLTANELKKKLKLKDGGDIYLFGTTNKYDKHIVFICKKV